VNETTVRETLRRFIVLALIRDTGHVLNDGTPILSTGLVDSFSLAELAVFIEQEFGVYIPDPELTVARMDTLDQITARVLQDVVR
jgi:acyl carrier protein